MPVRYDDAGAFYVCRPEGYDPNNYTMHEPIAGEVFNQRMLPSPEGADRLRRIATGLRIVRSHTFGSSFIETSSDLTRLQERKEAVKAAAKIVYDSSKDLDGTPLAPSGSRAISPKGFRVTPTSGRKGWLYGPARGFPAYFGMRYPHSLDLGTPDRKPLSIKGIGSPFHPLTVKAFMAHDQINGYTGLTRDHAMSEYLADGKHEIIDMLGCVAAWEFIPGRELAYAGPLDKIIVPDANGDLVIELSDPASLDDFPLLRGDDRPYAMLHLNWSDHTPTDIRSLARRSYSSKEPGAQDQGRSEIVRVFREIYDQLLSHPHFYGWLKDIDPSSGNQRFFKQMISRFVTAELYNSYNDAELIARKQAVLNHRHGQNAPPGGHTDFEGSLLHSESAEAVVGGEVWTPEAHKRIRDYTFMHSVDNVYLMLEDLSYFLHTDERAAIVAQFHALVSRSVSDDRTLLQELEYGLECAVNDEVWSMITNPEMPYHPHGV